MESQNFVNIDSSYSLPPIQCQAMTYTNDDLLLIRYMGINFSGRNFSENSITIQVIIVIKMHLKMLSAKGQPFCSGFNVLIYTNDINKG